jgi:hypothetical protein
MSTEVSANSVDIIWKSFSEKGFSEYLEYVLEDGEITPIEAENLLSLYHIQKQLNEVSTGEKKEIVIRYTREQVKKLIQAMWRTQDVWKPWNWITDTWIKQEVVSGFLESRAKGIGYRPKNTKEKQTQKKLETQVNVPKILTWFNLEYIIWLAKKTSKRVGIKDPLVVAALITTESAWKRNKNSFDGSSRGLFQLNTRHYNEYKDSNWKPMFKSRQSFINYLDWGEENEINAFRIYVLRNKEHMNLLGALNSANFNKIKTIYNPFGESWYAEKLENYHKAFNQYLA